MVTYDTKEVAIQKSEFIRDWNLGGAMWWESSADKAGPESLIGTVSFRFYRASKRLSMAFTDLTCRRFLTRWSAAALEWRIERTCLLTLQASTTI